MRSPIESRRADLERVDAMTIKDHVISGLIEVNGAGEVAIDVNFPVWFTEKPSTYFGGELGDGHSPTTTDFPTISVMVLRWAKETRGLGDYWTGATLGIVTTGEAEHQVIAHWHMEGKALRNPVGGKGDTDDSI
jgi:hypothetical protein